MARTKLTSNLPDGDGGRFYDTVRILGFPPRGVPREYIMNPKRDA